MSIHRRRRRYHCGTAHFSVAPVSRHESALASGALVAMARKIMYFILFYFILFYFISLE